MKKVIFFLLSFVLLFQGVITQTSAAGLPLWPHADNANSAKILSQRIQTVLSKYGPNHAILGSTCTTPQMYFQSLQKIHPEIDITSPNEVPGYLNNLVAKRFKDADPNDLGEQIPMTRVMQFANGTCEIQYAKVSRTIGPDDWVFVDPNTGKIILADCGNVTEMPQLRVIAVVHAYAKPRPAPIPTLAPVVAYQAPPVHTLPPMIAHCWISMVVLGYDRPQPIVVEINGRPVHTLFGSPQPRFYKVPCLAFAHAQEVHLCLVGSPSGEGFHLDLDEARRAMAEAVRRYRAGQFHTNEPIEVIFNRRIAVLHNDGSRYGGWQVGSQFLPPPNYGRVPFVFAAHVQTRGINTGVTIIH